jgi:chaperonin GroEL (HSP60 family)
MSLVTENAGLEGSVVVQRVKQEKVNVGYDVNQDAYVDMLDAGVIDPTKVTRTALQNAASIAALLLTTEAVVTEKPEKEEKMGSGMQDNKSKYWQKCQPSQGAGMSPVSYRQSNTILVILIYII